MFVSLMPIRIIFRMKIAAQLPSKAAEICWGSDEIWLF